MRLFNASLSHALGRWRTGYAALPIVTHDGMFTAWLEPVEWRLRMAPWPMLEFRLAVP